ncbi:hypothetical protein GEM_4912 [Burkholderia cepacia GG4]|uniref:Uncharacterized protein n=1 Tax=Burkholderia cepacia GG4 TaxID=1009846 RepID=A0A9W3K571_BURCE|nr:hypothetical protein GEM_4912 [Burkholderia cepacia GG4]
MPQLIRIANGCLCRRPQAFDVNTRRPGAGEPAPECTCPCGSGWQAGRYRAGADDRESAGSASHQARRDGQSMHAGRRQDAWSSGDASNHCDRGLPAAACGDRSFFVPRSRSVACFGNRTTPVLRRSDDGPCRAEHGCVARPAVHPRGLRPGRPSHGSLPNRPDATSSTFARGYSQGAGQLRAGPSAQGFRRTNPRPGQAGHAGRCETETCGARKASALPRQRLAGQGAPMMRKIFPARAAGRRPRLPHRFARPPARNVSRALHAPGRTRTGRQRGSPTAVQPTRWWSSSPDGAPSFPPLSPLLS